MTPANPHHFISAVLQLYLQLPETPGKAGPHDRRSAADLLHRGIPLLTVEAALLLASLRRLARSPDMPPLSPIRSLAYFLPVILELQQNPVPDGYLLYMRRKLQLLQNNYESR